MSSPLSLRRTRVADLQQVRIIQSQCYRDLPPDRYRALRSRLRAGGDACMVAEHRGELVGHVQALAWPLGHVLRLDQHVDERAAASGDVLFVYEVAIAPRHQGLGAGRRLMKHVETVARARSLEGLALVAYGEALGYWVRLGFEPHPLRDDEARQALASYGGKGQYLVKRFAPT